MNCVYQILRIKGNTVWTINLYDTVYEGLHVIAEKDVGALVVLASGGKAVGIFSERDYARKVILKGKSSLNTLVNELMVTNVYTVKTDDTIEYCMKLMSEKRIRHLPVMKDEKLIGLISIGDVVNHLLLDQKFHIKELTKYITGSNVNASM